MRFLSGGLEARYRGSQTCGLSITPPGYKLVENPRIHSDDYASVAGSAPQAMTLLETAQPTDVVSEWRLMP